MEIREDPYGEPGARAASASGYAFGFTGGCGGCGSSQVLPIRPNTNWRSLMSMSSSAPELSLKLPAVVLVLLYHAHNVVGQVDHAVGRCHVPNGRACRGSAIERNIVPSLGARGRIVLDDAEDVV